MLQIKDKIILEVTVTNKYEFETHYGWLTQYRTIYAFEDAEGQAYVWNTTGYLYYSLGKVKDENGTREYGESVEKGDVITIKATVKDFTEYKGKPQVELQRVKCIDRKVRAPRWEEIKAAKEQAAKEKEQAQRNSLKGKDFIERMPYKQYKDHYADCETVENSFQRSERTGVCTIEVIIREGRLKPSGVRGEQFHRYAYLVKDADGKKIRTVYKAVCADNAEKRLRKEYPGMEYELDEIYLSGR